jgi:uncharacterized membrane protein YphA (DoxX/SURF4 family)
MDIILVIGRVLYGGFFIYNAYNHFAHADALAGYAASKGVPMAKLGVLASGALIFLGGLSIFLGVRPALGAWAVVLFLIPVTYMMHSFWKEEGPAKATQKIMFQKNTALLGAALMIAALYR